MLGSWGSLCALSAGCVALVRGWTELLGICSKYQGQSSVQLVCAAPKESFLVVLEGAVGQLKGSVVRAVRCPYCRFLTALTSYLSTLKSLFPEWYFWLLFRGFNRRLLILWVSGMFPEMVFLLPSCAEAGGDECPQ